MQTDTSTHINRFEHLVDLYGDTVTRICYLRTKNVSDAEDCWQNVFLKLFKSADMWYKSAEELKRWIITVTLNECRDTARKLFYRRHDNIDELIIQYTESFDKTLITAVRSLPPKYSCVIYLHYYEGYSVKEISVLLCIKENTIKCQLKRGRELLKGVLSDE